MLPLCQTINPMDAYYGLYHGEALSRGTIIVGWNIPKHSVGFQRVKHDELTFKKVNFQKVRCCCINSNVIMGRSPQLSDFNVFYDPGRLKYISLSTGVYIPQRDNSQHISSYGTLKLTAALSRIFVHSYIKFKSFILCLIEETDRRTFWRAWTQVQALAVQVYKN